MAVSAAVIGAASSLAAQGAATQANKFEGTKNRVFNAWQAKLQRDWASNEAATAREFNAQQAQIERDWSENLANTAVQRKMQDLKNAGINPILASSEGATVPSAGAARAALASGSAASSSGSHVSSAVSIPNIMERAETRDEVLKNLANSAQLAENMDIKLGYSDDEHSVFKRRLFVRNYADQVSHAAAEQLDKLRG